MDDNVKKSKKLLRLLISRTKDLNFEQHNEIHALTISFYKKMLSSAQAILKLNPDNYNACILASHMMEGLIFLIWCLDKPKERIRQYVDYGAVEYLEGLYVHPEEKEDTLWFIKEKNVQRLLMPKAKKGEITDEVLLDHKNYYNAWYKPEANSINDMVKILVKDRGHKGIASIKTTYDRLCAYKHYSPYVMLPRFGTKLKIANHDEILALNSALQCLYSAFLYVNAYQPNPTNIDDITAKYRHIEGIVWEKF